MIQQAVTAALPSPLLETKGRRIEALRMLAGYGGAALGVTVGLVAAIWVTLHVSPDPILRDGALFIHLVSVVVGMGAVLTLDWFAAKWMLGHHEKADLLRLVGGAHTLIWIGLAGLTLSGMFLEPDLTSRMTQVKLVAVLAVALNGLHAHRLQHALESAENMSWLLMARAGLVATISQVGWWTAVLVGHLNTR